MLISYKAKQYILAQLLNVLFLQEFIKYTLSAHMYSSQPSKEIAELITKIQGMKSIHLYRLENMTNISIALEYILRPILSSQNQDATKNKYRKSSKKQGKRQLGEKTRQKQGVQVNIEKVGEIHDLKTQVLKLLKQANSDNKFSDAYVSTDSKKKQIQDRMDLLNIWIDLIFIDNDIQPKNGANKNTNTHTLYHYMSTLCMNLIVGPIVDQIKINQVISIVDYIWKQKQKVKAKIAIGKTTNAKIPIKYFLLQKLLQTLSNRSRNRAQKGENETYEQVQKYLINQIFLDDSNKQKLMTEIFNTVLELSVSGYGYCFMKIGKILFQQYIQQFVGAYSQANVTDFVKFDPSIVGALLKGLIALSKSVQIEIVKTYPSHKLSEKEEQQLICHYCGQRQKRLDQQKISPQYHFVILSVSKKHFFLSICKQCIKTWKNPEQNLSQLLLPFGIIGLDGQTQIKHLWDLIDNQQMMGDRIKQQTIINRESNNEKQLKIASGQILKASIYHHQYQPLYSQIWSMLLLLVNHNHHQVRIKSIKIVAELVQKFTNALSHSHNLQAKIHKCLNNRLYDTVQGVRQQAIGVLLMLPHCQIQNILKLIRKQFNLLPNTGTPTNAKNSSNLVKQLKRIFQQLCKYVENNVYVAVSEKRYSGERQMSNMTNICSAVIGLCQLNLKIDNLSARRSVTRASLSKQQQQQHKIKQSIVKSIGQENMDQLLQQLLLNYDLMLLYRQYGQNSNLLNYALNVVGEDIPKTVLSTMVKIILNKSQKHYGTQENRLFAGIWLNNMIISRQLLSFTNQQLLGDLADVLLTAYGYKQAQDRMQISMQDSLYYCDVLRKIILSTQTHSQRYKNPLLSYKNPLLSYKNPLLSDRNSINHFDIHQTITLVRHQNLWDKLQSLWKLLVNQILPTIDTRSTQAHHSISNVCSLLIMLDNILGDFAPTTNLCEKYLQFLTDKMDQNISQTEVVVDRWDLMVHAMNVLVGLIPVIGKPKQSVDKVYKASFSILIRLSNFPKDNKRVNQIFEQSVWILTRLILMQPSLITNIDNKIKESQNNIVEHLLAHQNMRCTNMFLLAVSTVMQNNQQTRLAEKVKNIFCQHICPQQISVNPVLNSVLKCVGFYSLMRTLLKKGFLHHMHCSPFIFYGLQNSLKSENSYGQQSSSSCVEILKDREQIISISSAIISQFNEDADIVQSKRLFTNFSQTITLIIEGYQQSSLSLKQIVSKDFPYFLDLSHVYCPKQIKIMSTHEETVSSLRPSILKSLADIISQLSVTNKILRPEPITFHTIFFILNTFHQCLHMPVSNYRHIISTLKNVIDNILIQGLSTIKKREQSGLYTITVLKLLLQQQVSLLQNYSFKMAYSKTKQLFQIVHPQLIKVNGLQSSNFLIKMFQNSRSNKEHKKRKHKSKDKSNLIGQIAFMNGNIGQIEQYFQFLHDLILNGNFYSESKYDNDENTTDNPIFDSQLQSDSDDSSIENTNINKGRTKNKKYEKGSKKVDLVYGEKRSNKAVSNNNKKKAKTMPKLSKPIKKYMRSEDEDEDIQKYQKKLRTKGKQGYHK